PPTTVRRSALGGIAGSNEPRGNRDAPVSRNIAKSHPRACRRRTATMITPRRLSEPRSTLDIHADPLSRPIPIRGLGLLTPDRQARLLRGIAERFRQGTATLDQLAAEHLEQTEQLDRELTEAHEATISECRVERRSTLGDWDQVDEQTIAAYEQETLSARKARHHALASIRHQRKREITEEEGAY